MRLQKDNVSRITDKKSEIRRLKEMGFREVTETQTEVTEEAQTTEAETEVAEETQATEAEKDESPVPSASPRRRSGKTAGGDK